MRKSDMKREQFNDLKDKVLRVAHYGKEMIEKSESYEKIKGKPDHLYNVENFNEELMQFQRHLYFKKGYFEGEIAAIDKDFIYGEQEVSDFFDDMIYKFKEKLCNIEDKNLRALAYLNLEQLKSILSYDIENRKKEY